MVRKERKDHSTFGHAGLWPPYAKVGGRRRDYYSYGSTRLSSAAYPYLPLIDSFELAQARALRFAFS